MCAHKKQCDCHTQVWFVNVWHSAEAVSSKDTKSALQRQNILIKMLQRKMTQAQTGCTSRCNISYYIHLQTYLYAICSFFRLPGVVVLLVKMQFCKNTRLKGSGKKGTFHRSFITCDPFRSLAHFSKYSFSK